MPYILVYFGFSLQLLVYGWSPLWVLPSLNSLGDVDGLSYYYGLNPFVRVAYVRWLGLAGHLWSIVVLAFAIFDNHLPPATPPPGSHHTRTALKLRTRLQEYVRLLLRHIVNLQLKYVHQPSQLYDPVHQLVPAYLLLVRQALQVPQRVRQQLEFSNTLILKVALNAGNR